jgi:hypothetical protein
LGASLFRLGLINRARTVEFATGLSLRVCGPEDLIITKVFARRERDWDDVEGIVKRQRETLDWSLIQEAVTPLLETIEEPERMARLLKLHS